MQFETQSSTTVCMQKKLQVWRYYTLTRLALEHLDVEGMGDKARSDRQL